MHTEWCIVLVYLMMEDILDVVDLIEGFASS